MFLGKRGETMTIKELGYLALSIIIIVALLFAAARIAGDYFNKEKKQALGTLDSFKAFLEDPSRVGKEPFVIYAPQGYYLEYAAFKPIITETLSCLRTRCICICAEEGCGGEKSYCIETDKELSIIGKIKIEEVTSLNALPDGKRYKVEQA